ncbi:MAG TPA: molybdopterin dehydrogenase [Peptococcaceae bacterium]|nr:molybdopterin dehydrogenase [Peptococcaceae bacterium]
MKIMWQDYYRPRTIDEALEILAAHNGEARIIAGGTDLVLDLKNKSKQARYLVDIRSIEGMGVIEEKGGKIYLGAGVTHSQAANSQLIREKATALAEAAAQVGSLQIRNVGTVVGNVVNAQPAADAAVALVALEAEAEIVHTDGRRELVKVEDLYVGPGHSKVDSTRSIVTGVYIPERANCRSVFGRIAPRRSLALPVINVAVTLALEGRRVSYTRIAAGPVGFKPLRLGEVEDFLLGKELSDEIIRGACKKAAEIAQPRNSRLRGSKEYRQYLVGVLLERAYKELAG